MAPKKQVKIVVPETSKPAKAAPAPKAAAPAAAKTAQKTAQVAKKATPAEKKAAPAPASTEEKKTAPATKKGGKKEKKAPAGKKTTEPYTALELSNLPEAFQEPQLRKFLSQFGPVVASCYVARTKAGRSRGTGWVVFSSKRNTPSPVFVGANGMTPSREQLMDAILDECNGMLLGGKTVQARWVVRRTPMPTRAAVDAMRERDWVSKTEGKPLERHEASTLKSWVNRLKHGAAAEKKANAYFKENGIAYEFDGFTKQTALLTPELTKAANAFIKAIKVGRNEVRKVVRKAANVDKVKTRQQEVAKKAKLVALKKAAHAKSKAKRVAAKKADAQKAAGKRPARGTANKYVTKKAAKSGAAPAKKAPAAVPVKKAAVAKKAVVKK